MQGSCPVRTAATAATATLPGSHHDSHHITLGGSDLRPCHMLAFSVFSEPGESPPPKQT